MQANIYPSNNHQQQVGRTSMSWLHARRMLGNSAFMLDVLKALATAFLRGRHKP